MESRPKMNRGRSYGLLKDLLEGGKSLAEIADGDFPHQEDGDESISGSKVGGRVFHYGCHNHGLL